ncbi:MAG: beta-lactamase family protein [Candidatus Heimdallarchaeota archaeon]|nr:beta-lactamase family protein [Candidatus Heimdallarchaeota archaeon]
MELQTENRPSDNAFFDKIDQFRILLERLTPFDMSASVVIGVGDEIKWSKVMGFQHYEHKIEMKETTAMSIGSIAKQVTAVGILQLVDQGLLSLDNPLSTYFESVPSEKGNITVHQLLTHISGFKDGLGDDFDLISRDEFIETAFSKPLMSKPSEKFIYSNLGYSMLAIIIELITKKSYQEFVRKDLFFPLGITYISWFGDPLWNNENSVQYYVDGVHTGSIGSWNGSWDSNKSYWHILGNGGICISAPDFFLWMRALIGGKLISRESLDSMFTPGLDNYGYGWVIHHTLYGRMISHNGGSTLGVNATVRYYENTQTTIIIFSNIVDNGFGQAFQLEKALDRILENDSLVMPPKPTDLLVTDVSKFPEVFEFGESEGKIGTQMVGSYILQLKGQDFSNFIFDPEKAQSEIYKACNNKVVEFGQYIVSREWDKAFALTLDGTPSANRVGILSQILDHIHSEFGEIHGVKCLGTIPYANYYAMSLLSIEAENGSLAFPIIWADERKIRGFRPMFTKSLITFRLISDTDNSIIGYSIDYGISIRLSLQIDNRIIFTNINTGKTLVLN